MEWDNDNCIMAIEAYKKHRLLWDPKHPGYFMKNRKQEAWNAMAAELNIDMEEVKKKMNSLLGSYRRERSRIKQSMLLNRGAYKSKWFAIESFSFLTDRDDIKNGYDSFSYDEFQEMQSTYFHSDMQNYEDIKQEHSPSDIGQNPQIDIIEPNDSKRRRTEGFPDSLFRISPEEDDEFNAFGSVVAAKLRKMTPLQRLCAEHIINETLFNGALDKLRPNSIIYTPPDGDEVNINTKNNEYDQETEMNENRSESNENTTENNMLGFKIEIQKHQPAAKENEPEVNGIQPEENENQLKVNGNQPEVIENQLQVNGNEPEVIENQLDQSGNQPEVNVNQPEVNENQPVVNENHPELNISQSDTPSDK